MMERAHTHAHEYSHTHRGSLTHLPAQPYPQLTLSVPIHMWASQEQPGTSTHTLHMFLLPRLSSHNHAVMSRQVMFTYMYKASTYNIKFGLCTHNPCMCTHKLCRLVPACTHTGCTQTHTNAFQDTHAQEPNRRTRTTQIPRALPELVGQPLRGWSLPPAPPLSTKDTQLRTMTEGRRLRSQG